MRNHASPLSYPRLTLISASLCLPASPAHAQREINNAPLVTLGGHRHSGVPSSWTSARSSQRHREACPMPHALHNVSLHLSGPLISHPDGQRAHLFRCLAISTDTCDRHVCYCRTARRRLVISGTGAELAQTAIVHKLHSMTEPSALAQPHRLPPLRTD